MLFKISELSQGKAMEEKHMTHVSEVIENFRISLLVRVLYCIVFD